MNFSNESRKTHSCLRGMLVAGLSVALCGCAPLAMTVIGVGATAGLQHAMSGAAHRTFTAPLPETRKAVVSALKRMEIVIDGTQRSESGEKIAARAIDRDIEITLEIVTANTTRIRTSARNGLWMDSATANEIIAQTEKTLRQRVVADNGPKRY